MRYILSAILCIAFVAAHTQQKITRYDTLSIPLLEKEVVTAKQPFLSVLYSILASKYYDHFQQNRWKIYDRTNTINFKKEDIDTWTITDFHARISRLYLASIQEEKLLRQTPLKPYDSLIIKGNMRHLRPTLYDLLTHEALAYFRNNERDINKPAYAFEIKDPAYFALASAFINLKITTNDTLSLQHKALQLYQKLLALHLNDTKPDALIDADITRIEFVNQYGVMENKDSLYLKALQQIADEYQSLPAAAQAWYLIAKWHADKAATYEPFKDSTYRYGYVIAKKICEAVLTQKDSSEGKVNCYNLLKEINLPRLSLKTEKVNLPGQPFRTLVEYRNITHLYLRIIPLTETIKRQLENNIDGSDARWKLLASLKPAKSWMQSLPVTADFQQHRTEIKVDGLQAGSYLLLAGSKEDFSFTDNSLAMQQLQISIISYINKGNEFFVLHRQTGQPLVKAKVNVYRQEYNSTIHKYVQIPVGNYTTDEHGYFAVNERHVSYTYFIDIKYGNDFLKQDEPLYIPYFNGKEPTVDTAGKIFFFTDRSIYRPGQTVYFKGIVINSSGKKNWIAAGAKRHIFLENTNDDDIDSLEVTTNEFGSFSGKFQLPQNQLNGIFRIYNDPDDTDDEFDLEESSVSFSVEEYKRPKFSVAFDQLTQTYKVNDSITVTGMAQAYAGNNIDGAKVNYRVVRQARFIYPWLYRGYYPRTSSMEIVNGTTTTDANGHFTVRFKAIPDLSISKQTDPVFDYKVYADVIDISGETRSGNQSVSVAYKSLLLRTKIDPSLPTDSLRALYIRTENMNGAWQPSNVTVSIYKLIPEQRLIRSRYWEQPDVYVLSKEEYILYFPHDEYSNEANYINWARGEKVFERSDSTRQEGTWQLGNISFTEGYYVIEITTVDKERNKIKDFQYTKLYNEKSNQLPVPAWIWTQSSKVIEPGETATIGIGSSASDIFVIQKRNNRYNYFKIDKEKKTLFFKATEEDRGGYPVSFAYVKDNRVYQFKDMITVPWTNKELAIEYTSYRDKTLPGSEEKWKVKISGSRNERVAAEMLASMYDASLDQFKNHYWNTPYIWRSEYETYEAVWNDAISFRSVNSEEKWINTDYLILNKQYDALKTSRNQYTVMIQGRNSLDETVVVAYGTTTRRLSTGNVSAVKAEALQKAGNPLLALQGRVPGLAVEEDNTTTAKDEVTIRKNFSETAFFFPDLRTDAAGNIEFSFTMPEALTRWKFQALTHTKELAFGYSTRNIITQKDLMVQPNMPRFLREGDKIELSTKVVNMTDKELNGIVQLQLLNASTMQPIDALFHNTNASQSFTAAAGQSVAATFAIDIPDHYKDAIVYRFVAKAGNVSDGEEASLPVLTNRMLVTESMPLPVRGNTSKNFRFEKLLQSGNSNTLQQHALTVEYTSNPAWYAVQALPYLMEYPYECAEQTFNRFYANALAAKIANSTPKLKAVFEKWLSPFTKGGQGDSALLSNLQKNQELKSILLEETPWVLQAKNEAQQKKNIALLFDMLRMEKESTSSLDKLLQSQTSNGGFSWFKGGPDDRYITQYIVSSIGHLQKMEAVPAEAKEKINTILKKALPYLDARLKEDYDQLLKWKTKLSDNNLGYTQIQYLYMRSFFPQHLIPSTAQIAVNYYRNQAKLYWLKNNRYMQGMIALSLHQNGDRQTPVAILASLKENAIVNEEMGMYWKENSGGYYWHQAPVETQSLLIEAFSEISKDNKIADDLKTWLLKQKQTQSWGSTKATADACYALLLQGSNWLSADQAVEITLGDIKIVSTEVNAEAGTGYFKTSFSDKEIKPAMGNIAVKVSSADSSSSMPSWGAVYWQYFEQLDKITPASTPLRLDKKLFVEKNTDRGPVLQPVNEGGHLKAGDKIKVRIELRVDRDMEYVHMKDMRAACMEPVNVISSYKWQGGLGYYESTKDASTNFFFNWLPKGTYVFEYPLFVMASGNFSNGITSIQCMYAPEFSSHSEGIRIKVE